MKDFGPGESEELTVLEEIEILEAFSDNDRDIRDASGDALLMDGE